MKKSSMYAIVAVVIIIIIIAGVAAWYYTSNPGTPSETPTPTATTAVDVADATTLEFEVDSTMAGFTLTYGWNVTGSPNVSAASLKIRVDSMGTSYVLDTTGSTPTVYTSADGGATWTAGDFATLWGTEAAPGFGTQWADYLKALTTQWDGDPGDSVSFTDSAGNAVVIYNIQVNPTIPDSTYATS